MRQTLTATVLTYISFRGAGATWVRPCNLQGRTQVAPPLQISRCSHGQPVHYRPATCPTSRSHSDLKMPRAQAIQEHREHQLLQQSADQIQTLACEKLHNGRTSSSACLPLFSRSQSDSDTESCTSPESLCDSPSAVGLLTEKPRCAVHPMNAHQLHLVRKRVVPLLPADSLIGGRLHFDLRLKATAATYCCNCLCVSLMSLNLLSSNDGKLNRLLVTRSRGTERRVRAGVGDHALQGWCCDQDVVYTQPNQHF